MPGGSKNIVSVGLVQKVKHPGRSGLSGGSVLEVANHVGTDSGNIRQISIPLDWQEQLQVLGFNA